MPLGYHLHKFLLPRHWQGNIYTPVHLEAHSAYMVMHTLQPGTLRWFKMAPRPIYSDASSGFMLSDSSGAYKP